MARGERTESGPSLCCIPVSWPTGFGEFSRQLTLADAARRRWPDLRCHFILNRHLPDAARALLPSSYGVTWLDTSPTDDDAGVAAALAHCRPDVVLFDNAGTGAQCQRAKDLGAQTIFLSTRAATQARGFGTAWLPSLDEHWLIGPRALADPLPAEQRAAAAAHGIAVRAFDALFMPYDWARGVALRQALGCAAKPYVSFLPGGGGGTVDGRSAISLFTEAAAMVAERTGIICMVLHGPLAPDAAPPPPGVMAVHASHSQVVDLVEVAQCVVLGASSSLFQALAQKKVCVASAAGGSEQLKRARLWGARGVVAAAEPDPAALAAAACAVLTDGTTWPAVRQRVDALGVENHLEAALDVMSGRLAPRS